MSAGLPLLRVEELSVRLKLKTGLLRAVEQVSFLVRRGETLAIVGESGSGKSLLCRSLLGLAPRCADVKARGIHFAGRDLSCLPDRELAALRGRELAVVLQDPLSALNPVRRIGAQLAEPLRRHLGMTSVIARERSGALLEAVGLPNPRQQLDAYPHQLSGGMRQRVVIAMALACDPLLLIADEPTTALDVTVQAEILNLLGRLQRERNMGMILVTHDLGVVAGRAQQTAVMYAGRIVELAPTSRLFSDMCMPYTRALLDSIPKLDDPVGKRLQAIDGQPPDLTALPNGCAFAPRCPRAQSLCFTKLPSLTATADNLQHSYACWFPLDAKRRAV